MISKICSKCGEEKLISKFHKDSKGKFGVRKECKICVAKRHKKYNKDKYKIWKEKHEKEGTIIYWNRRASRINDKVCKRYELDEKLIGRDLFVKFKDIKTCFYCDDSIFHETCHIEHKIPLSMGGTNNINNIVFSCGKCNHTKGIKSDKEFFEYVKRIYNNLKENYK